MHQHLLLQDVDINQMALLSTEFQFLSTAEL